MRLTEQFHLNTSERQFDILNDCERLFFYTKNEN